MKKRKANIRGCNVSYVESQKNQKLKVFGGEKGGDEVYENEEAHD